MDYKLQAKPTLVPPPPQVGYGQLSPQPQRNKGGQGYFFPSVYFLFLLYFLPSIYAFLLC